VSEIALRPAGGFGAAEGSAARAAPTRSAGSDDRDDDGDDDGDDDRDDDRDDDGDDDGDDDSDGSDMNPRLPQNERARFEPARPLHLAAPLAPARFDPCNRGAAETDAEELFSRQGRQGSQECQGRKRRLNHRDTEAQSKVRPRISPPCLSASVVPSFLAPLAPLAVLALKQILRGCAAT
jgi:hypothetical protein